MSRFFSIMTPPFDPLSGGIKVMWSLYGWLLSKGQIAYTNATAEDKDFCAIYPEIYPPDNPSGAKKVIRYILNRVGTMALYGTPGPMKFNPSDEIYVFSRIFDTFGVDDDHVLFLPALDLFTFYDKGKKRERTAYFVGKGLNTNVHPENAVAIDRRVAQDQEALAELLNECECLYCYDPVTAMTEIARLSGTRVVIIPSIYTKEEYSKYEPGLNGISWGIDESIPLDAKAFREHYIGLRDEFSRKLDLLIERTR